MRGWVKKKKHSRYWNKRGTSRTLACVVSSRINVGII